VELSPKPQHSQFRKAGNSDEPFQEFFFKKPGKPLNYYPLNPNMLERSYPLNPNIAIP